MMILTLIVAAGLTLFGTYSARILLRSKLRPLLRHAR